MDWGTFLGRFHPLLVHLPIGMVILAVILEWLDRYCQPNTRRLVWGLAGLSAVLSIVAGWLLANQGAYENMTLFWHRWSGIAIGICAVLATFWQPKNQLVKKYFSVFTILLLTLAGHLGGRLTHGEHYLTEHAPGWLQDWSGHPAPAPHPSTHLPVDSLRFYPHLIQPFLDQKCVHCHDAAGPNGGLRVDDAAAVFVGGDEGPAVIPGRAEESSLYERVIIDPGHRKFMPPNGDPLSYGEIRLLEFWIQSGADTVQHLKAMAIPKDIEALLARDYALDLRPKPFAEQFDFPPLDSSLVVDLKNKNFLVRNVSTNSHAVEVNVPYGSVNTADLEPIAGNIIALKLEQQTINDFSIFQKMTYLQSLSLRQAQFPSASDLLQLKTLPYLEILNLGQTTINKEDIIALCQQLPRLRKLFIWETGITPEEHEALQQQFESIEIIHHFSFTTKNNDQ